MVQLILGSAGGYAAAYAVAKKVFGDSSDFPAWAILITVPITPIGLVPAVLTAVFIGEILLGIPYGEGGVLKSFLGPFAWVVGVTVVAHKLQEPDVSNPTTPASSHSGRTTSPADASASPTSRPIDQAQSPQPPSPPDAALGQAITSARRCVHDSAAAIQELRDMYPPGSALSGIGTALRLERIRRGAEELQALSEAIRDPEVSRWLLELASLLATQEELAWTLIATATHSRLQEYEATLSALAAADSQIAAVLSHAPGVTFTG